ncbi:MAG: hypothetical protein PHX62_00745 [Bacilli bacterium]|nr:hypothetical protein [Bacilli bacterium]
MRNKVIIILLFFSVFVLTSCQKNSERNLYISFQKEFKRVEIYDKNIPDNYQIIDFKNYAELFDQVIYDESLTGSYLPLIWDDNTYDSYGIAAYVGDPRYENDGAQEAVTVIASVLSATQIDLDKRTLDRNYVSELISFYSETEKVVLNNPAGSSKTTSMWYMLYPAILFTQVSILYPEELTLRAAALENIESWYQAYLVMYNDGNPDFDVTGFDFTTMQSYKNGIWKEPDCAVGISLLLYYGYKICAKEEYLEAALGAMDYQDSFFGSPMYEAIYYFAPTLAAYYNSKYGKNYQIGKILNEIFDGNSIPRGGWGSIVGKWGNYNVTGLMGSITDGGGYAFAMNTFLAAYAISSLPKYDARYASSIGKWILNLASNSRYFFPEYSDSNNQSAPLNQKAMSFIQETNGVVPYEGIRKSSNSKTPWFGGDPTAYGWAETDFSLYSGAHIGLLASIFEETDIEAILKIDLNKSDFLNKSYPTYLLYNPYSETKEVTYTVNSSTKVDLYDSVTKKVIARDVESSTKLSIAAFDSLVIVELPKDAGISFEDGNYYVNNKFIATSEATIQVINYLNNDEVSGKFQIKIALLSNYPDDKIKKIEVAINKGKEIEFTDPNKLLFSTQEIGYGGSNFTITVYFESGLIDSAELRLLLKK